MSTTTNCYSKNHRVRVMNSRSEDRFKDIHVTIDYQTTTVPTLKKELIIKLTDENDPFFLYSLFMGEDDYQMLKAQQGFLVDHGSFGTHLIELLKKCEEDQATDSPKYQFQIYTKEPLPHDHGPAIMNIVEMNSFKHLQHITLNLAPANDTDIKKYLATCWQSLREAYSKLARQHDELKMNASQEVKGLQMAVALKNGEYEKLKIEHDAVVEAKNIERHKEVTFERERALQTQHSLQQKLEQEKKEIEQMYQKTVRNLETRVLELEQANKDLHEKKYKFEIQLQEVRTKYTTVQEEYNQLKQDSSQSRKENTSLEAKLAMSEKSLNSLVTKVAVLEQELKDKNEKVASIQDQMTSEQALRRQKEDLLKEREDRLRKITAQLNHARGELEKGSVSYGKLKLELSETRKKLGESAAEKQSVEQQKSERDKEIELLNAEIKKLKDQIFNLTQESGQLENNLQKKSKDLDEAMKTINKNESMINWLNRQLSAVGIAHGSAGGAMDGVGAGLNGANGTVSFKPHGSLLSNGADTSANGILKVGSSGLNQFSAAKNGGNNTDLLSTLNSTSGRNMMAASTGLPLSYSGSSTNNNYPSRLSSESHDNCESPTSSMTNMNRLTIAPVSNPTGPAGQISSRLDPKYFQSHSPPTAFDSNSNGFKPMQTRSLAATTNPAASTVAVAAATSSSIDVGAKPAAPIKSNLLTNATNTTAAVNAGQQLYNGARLNKQLIQQPSLASGAASAAPQPAYAALLPTKSTPPIMSAYFH